LQPAGAAFLQRFDGKRASGEKKSTLKIRVKWRLNIWWHRPACEFPEREAPVLSLTGHKDEANA
jgi:hypothetical protein